jgi:hypothetical protein
MIVLLAFRWYLLALPDTRTRTHAHTHTHTHTHIHMYTHTQYSQNQFCSGFLQLYTSQEKKQKGLTSQNFSTFPPSSTRALHVVTTSRAAQEHFLV